MTPIKPGHHPGAGPGALVSILVLLDDSHQALKDTDDATVVYVSILVLLDDSHQAHFPDIWLENRVLRFFSHL